MLARVKRLVLAPTLLCLQTCFAAQSDPLAAADMPGTGVIDRLGQLQTEIVLLKAEAARAQARLALEQAQAPLLSTSGNQDIASLTRVFGRDNDLSAVVQFRNGQTQVIKMGDHLTGGYIVRHVAPSSVTLVRRNREIQIPIMPARTFAPPSVGQNGISETPPLPDRALR
ncbi:type IV pilus biogenesis protein PilP [Burkholderia cenocepacia]|uniref:type IV pilus biogenesis protein PilP n=1 Tax=Burkholderia cenocepacia TaxID=95486 RepID=UPI002AB22912|nr:type IV pilus biogenesis protein PilP [Burkholderia cenocepacia]